AARGDQGALRARRSRADGRIIEIEEGAVPLFQTPLAREKKGYGPFSGDWMDLLEKLRAIEKRRETFADASATPGATVIERVLGPCEVAIGGRPTLMFGSNNYLGLTMHPEVMAAARDAVTEFGTGTTGSRTAN